MGILTKLKDFFAKGPQEPEVEEVKEVVKTEEQDPQVHHHNHGSSTT